MKQTYSRQIPNKQYECVIQDLREMCMLEIELILENLKWDYVWDEAHEIVMFNCPFHPKRRKYTNAEINVGNEYAGTWKCFDDRYECHTESADFIKLIEKYLEETWAATTHTLCKMLGYDDLYDFYITRPYKPEEFLTYVKNPLGNEKNPRANGETRGKTSKYKLPA